MLEKYKMDFMASFPVIVLAFSFIIVSANWVAIQLKAYELLNPLSIIALIGAVVLISAFLIEFYKSIKKENTKPEENR
jgi:NADH:ubiquinone oxidoreductase subunit 6 (subunit J)